MKTCWTCTLLLLVCFRLTAQTHIVATPDEAHRVRSRIFIYDLRDGSSTLVYKAATVWEAPNWSPDGKYLIANAGGAIYKLVLPTRGLAMPQLLAIPADYQCNNDKALSPDGRYLGFSATRPPESGSEVYVADSDGSNIRQLTHTPPSYFHGWSPDGSTMSFVAQRNGSGQFDIYRVPAQGGEELQLNADPHHDDGPDYSPDGRWIYLNSDRSGHEAIWRFPVDGAGLEDQKAERVLADGAEDWFPHVSPDGSKLVYLAYPEGTPNHNPRDLQVELKMVTISNGRVSQTPKRLARFTGGQGTINVNSWAPDSERFAYVTYEALP